MIATGPTRALYTGARIPAIGFGTFGSDHANPMEVARAVRGAYEAGYRHFDCAAVYRNEEIGCALREAVASGIRREDLWVTSKLWNDSHAPEAVIPTCRRTLADLQLDYLDLYLVHWPFPNPTRRDATIAARNPAALPYIHANYMKPPGARWRSSWICGLVRHIGTSNMTIPKLRLLLPMPASGPRSTRWSCIRISSSRACSTSWWSTAFTRWATRRSVRPAGPRATARPKIPRTPKTR